MQSVSLVITYYDPLQKKVDMLCDLMRSIGEHSHGFKVDTVLVLNGPSYVESVNQGLERSQGDYVIVMNDDTLIQDHAWLQKMCKPDCVTAWQMGHFHLTNEPVPDAACFGMSKKVQQKIGLMDLKFKDGRNFEDTDYFFRAKELGIPFVDAQVAMTHFGNVTDNTYFNDVKWGKTYHNEAIFSKKWLPTKPT